MGKYFFWRWYGHWMKKYTQNDWKIVHLVCVSCNRCSNDDRFLVQCPRQHQMATKKWQRTVSNRYTIYWEENGREQTESES